jgi:hypothetical protein
MAHLASYPIHTVMPLWILMAIVWPIYFLSATMSARAVRNFRFGSTTRCQDFASLSMLRCRQGHKQSHSPILVLYYALFYYASSTDYAGADRDGTIDMIFATCSSVSQSTGVGTGCSINVAYNRQLPLCESSTSPSVVGGKTVCRPLDTLCQRDPNFKFDLSDREANDVCPSSELHPAILLMIHNNIGIR